MNTPLQSDKVLDYKWAETNIAEDGIAIIRNATGFPVRDYAFVTNQMVVNICNSGTAHALYDSRNVYIEQDEIAVVMPNHIIRPVETSDDYCITQMIVDRPILDLLKQRLSRRNYLKYYDTPACKITKEQKGTLLKIVEIIESALGEPIPYKQEQITNLLDVFFTLLEQYNPQRAEESHADQLYRRFCELVAENFRTSRNITYYAQKLQLSPKYFTRLISRSTGVKPSDFISDYVTIQAKQLLLSRPDISLQAAAEALGFPDQASFSRFFKRQAGITPKDFRKN